MRAVVASGPGGPEVLSVAEVAAPVPKLGEVLINVAATAVNRADLLQRTANYPPPPGASTILGLECSGTIAEIGEGVTGWQVGDEVCALLAGGGYAEQVAVPAAQLMHVPTGVDLITAGALPEVACTVWSMVFDQGRLAPGESFLVHGGASGIGTMAIQLAKAAGAKVFATAGSAAKLTACEALGADVVINYRDQDFAEVVQAAQAADGREGIDVLLDSIGAKYLERNVSCLALGGRISLIGMMGGRIGELNLATLMAKRGTIYAASLRARPLEQKAEVVAGTELYVWPLIAEGRVKPVVHVVLPFEQAAEAHRLVDASEHIGKVILRIGNPG
ncbi:NAD(P)H-quinone oxidoreductase [Jatrophihabitans sp. DSM 45814]